MKADHRSSKSFKMASSGEYDSQACHAMDPSVHDVTGYFALHCLCCNNSNWYIMYITSDPTIVFLKCSSNIHVTHAVLILIKEIIVTSYIHQPNITSTSVVLSLTVRSLVLQSNLSYTTWWVQGRQSR